MNLRMPGCTPFHMRVTFHALPGIELLGPKERSSILTGDGIYEETWLAPKPLAASCDAGRIRRD
jgi:hypothetical protein